MTKFIPLVESRNLLDLERLVSKVLGEKIADALEECQVYVAQRMFEDGDPRVAHQVNQDVNKYVSGLPKERQTESEREKTRQTLHSKLGIDYKWGKDEQGNEYHVLKHASDPDKEDNWHRVEDESQVESDAEKLHKKKQDELKGKK